MNNLNDPPRWNIPPRPDPTNGNQWNYALLVPMLGLAAFRWIWSRESQKEIQGARLQYDQEVSSLTAHLETKYRHSLTESRRDAAVLELELEKERQRVQGYRQALASQSRRLTEERDGLRLERDRLEQEKKNAVESGAAATVLRHHLEEESQWEQRTSSRLRELEEKLVERQALFCNLLLPRDQRLELEKNLLLKAVKEAPLGEGVDLETDLRDIFRNDRHCADRLLNKDKRRNGSLMWLYLRYWQLQVTFQKHKRAEEAVLGTRRSDDLK